MYAHRYVSFSFYAYMHLTMENVRIKLTVAVYYGLIFIYAHRYVSFSFYAYMHLTKENLCE